MSKALTKEDLTVTIGEFRKEINDRFKSVNGRFDGLRQEMTDNTRTIIDHFNKSQGFQNQRMDQMERGFNDQFGEVNVKLDAIIKMLVMRQEMHNLIRELKSQGMVLDESKIFVA